MQSDRGHCLQYNQGDITECKQIHDAECYKFQKGCLIESQYSKENTKERAYHDIY